MGSTSSCRISEQIDTTVILCQPTKILKKGDADVDMELSEAVKNAIPKAIQVILETHRSGLWDYYLSSRRRTPARNRQKSAAPQKTADVAPTATETKKEVKPVADKITVGYTHLSGCTGCTVALADNYAGLLTLLDKYVDLKYMPTLADARHIQKVDVSFVEGSVCINDKLAVAGNQGNP